MVFFDTNVLIYSAVAHVPQHTAAVRALQAFLGRPRWISRQVLREYLATLSRPQGFGAPAPMAVLTQQVEQFEQVFLVADETAQVGAELRRLALLVPMGGKQIHDANLVATMLVNGVTRLVTHNVADFQRFEPLIEVLPLSQWADPEPAS